MYYSKFVGLIGVVYCKHTTSILDTYLNLPLHIYKHDAPTEHYLCSQGACVGI